MVGLAWHVYERYLRHTGDEHLYDETREISMIGFAVVLCASSSFMDQLWDRRQHKLA